MGYFALVGLARVHCLLGDYYLSLRTLQPIDLTRRGLYTRVTACHVSLYYYLAFAYLMTRRYTPVVQVCRKEDSFCFNFASHGFSFLSGRGTT